MNNITCTRASAGNRIKRISFPVLIALVALSLVFAGLTMAAKTEGYATYTFYAGNNATAAAVGTGKVVADYGDLDCYETLDVASAQGVTTTFEHSPDNSVWVSSTAFALIAADGTIYAQVPISGAYMRIRTDLNSANNVTVTVKCTAKDRTH